MLIAQFTPPDPTRHDYTDRRVVSVRRSEMNSRRLQTAADRKCEDWTCSEYLKTAATRLERQADPDSNYATNKA